MVSETPTVRTMYCCVRRLRGTNSMVTRTDKLLAAAFRRAHALRLQVSPCVPIITETQALFIRLKYHYTDHAEHFRSLICSDSQPIMLQ